MKRALKKRVKAVLKNTPSSDGAPVEAVLKNTPSSDGAPVEQSNMINSGSTHRATTRAAMIGLAISMGATSLLVTRQSDQAQAAAPVGSQKAASTIPAVPDTEMKFAPTKLDTQTVSLVSVPENPVIVEPTAVSQVPGLEAKLRQIAASRMSVTVPVSATAAKTTTYRSSFYQQPQVLQDLQAANKLKQVQKLSIANSVVSSPTTSLTAVATENQAANSEVTAQLKAQQEFALNRLQEKSNRLKQSLAELRSEETKKLSQANTELAQSTSVVEKAPQINASNITTEHTPTSTNANQASLISKLKQAQASSNPVPVAVTPVVPTTIKTAAQSAAIGYEVKPGDTLAAIANRYGTSVSALAKANHLNNPNQLQISQQLVIPGAGVERNPASPSTLAINPTLEQSDTFSKVAPLPENSAVVNPTVAATPQLPVVANNTLELSPVNPGVANPTVAATPQLPVVANNNSVIVPTTPTTANNRIPANTAIASETVPSPANSYGVGGDVPVPKVFTEIQSNQKPQQKLASTKNNERLQSLQAEIQRLREKYRAQQAGVVTPVSSENENPAVSIPVPNLNNFAVSSPTNTRSSVPIAVPSPIGTTNYRVQPMKPLFRTPLPTNEPVNPAFVPYTSANK